VTRCLLVGGVALRLADRVHDRLGVSDDY